ncbi:hypothetical protein D3C75_916140 [compost metagenome]
MAGRKVWAMQYWLPWAVRVSMMTPTLASSSFMRKMEAPPMPSRGFRITSLCSAWKARSLSARRVTRVVGVCSANQAV